MIKKADKEFQFTKENLNKLEALKLRYPDKKALTLPVLWLIQYQNGWISEEAITYVSSLLDIPPVHFLEVASFYTMYNLEPKGKIHIRVCKTLSCQLRGSDELIDFLKSELNLKMHESSQDGNYTLDETECLGLCNEAPCLLLNYAQHSNLTVEKLAELIKVK
jgi:NADH-quinone oxidoreductase subunit E